MFVVPCGYTRVFSIAVLAVLSACSKSVSEPVEVLPLAKLTLLSGGNQTVRLGSALAQPIIVRLDTAGVPAPFVNLEFVVVADISPGPNHTWIAQTDQAGVAAGNGALTNTGARPATVTVKYVVCAVPGITSCYKFETRATVATSLLITP